MRILFYSCVLLFLNKVNCLERISLSTKYCDGDADCMKNSFCYGNDDKKRGVCKCKVNNYIFNGECLPAAEGVGSACVYDGQCELTLGLDSECGINNSCECLPSAHFVPSLNSCYKTARLNETCTVHENCRLPSGEAIYCTYGKCTCGVNEHPNTDASKCVKTSHLGSPCNSDDSCIHMNAVCRETCQCIAGYVVVNDQHNCVKAATTLGEPCNQLSECSTYLRHSECISGICSCAPEFHQIGNKCFRTKFIGEYCTDAKECVRNPSLQDTVYCKDVCTCKPGTNSEQDCALINASLKENMQIISLIGTIVLFIVI